MVMTQRDEGGEGKERVMMMARALVYNSTWLERRSLEG